MSDPASILSISPLLDELKQQTVTTIETLGRAPRLALLRCVSEPGSMFMEKQIRAACRDTGVECWFMELPSYLAEDVLVKAVHQIGQDNSVDAVGLLCPPQYDKSLLGSAIGYAAPFIWGALEPSMGRIMAIRITFVILAAIGLVALLVPTFTINEKEYVHTVPSNDDAFTSLIKTFRNGDFRIFVGSDVLYFLGLTIFQTGLPFFITSLMKLPETYTTILYVAMTLLSFACYMPVNALAHRMNKKKLVLIGFVGLAIVYLITAISGLLGGSGLVFGIIIVCAAAFPMAILGILPQAIVADIAEADAVTTGENREGMFFAARTFAFKFGQSIAMLVFTAFASIGTETGLGYRIAAVSAAVICLCGALILSRYNEDKILGIIVPKEK